jgi:hypothetical protein
MESQSLSPSSRLHIGDLVALGTTACLVGTVAFLQVKVVPTYVTVLVGGGYPLPFPQQVATWVCSFTTRYVLAGFLIWALYALSSAARHRTAVAFPLSRVLAVVNAVAVVVLMGQSSGFVEFARHGLKAAHNVVTAQEQATAKHVIQPASLPRR